MIFCPILLIELNVLVYYFCYQVTWSLNGSVLNSQNDIQVTTSGNHFALSIANVKKIHSGNVACVAENIAGKATCEATLSVEPEPKAIAPFSEPDIGFSQHVDSSSITVKRAIFVQSSSSSEVTTSATIIDGRDTPKTQIHTYKSEAEESMQQVGSKPPVTIQKKNVQEFHQVDKKEPQTNQESFVTITSGNTDVPQKSPVKSTRKSVPPKFIDQLNGKIVDQGENVKLEATIDGIFLYINIYLSFSVPYT